MWSPEKRYCWKIVLGEPVPRSERCHNWKGLQQSINICCRLSSGILIFRILFTNCLVLQNKREFQAHFVEYWEIRVFIKQPKRDSCKQKKLKLSFFPCLLCPLFLLLFLMNFGFCLICVPCLQYHFPLNFKGGLCHETY